MAGGNFFIHHHLLHPLIQFEKTHGIGNCGTALGNPLCQLVLLQIKLGQKTFEGHRFLDGVQVFPLNVLDQRDLHSLLLRIIFDDDRNFL